jgi:hypothetical protein
MTSFRDRYLRGECEQVWNELMALGANVREEPLYSDALAVARETMQRTRRNIEMLIPRLESFGYTFGYGWTSPQEADWVKREPPRLGQPADDVQEQIARLEPAGAVLPLSLRAFYEIVGAVNFVGEPSATSLRCPGDGVDPLYVDRLISLEEYQSELLNLEEGEPYSLSICPDNLVKYNISGVGSLYIEIPCFTADAQLCWEDEYLDETFVVYLRTCFQQGGFRDEPPLSETELAYVTKELLPI